ncbi:MAG: phosphate acyltransferase PlsX [Myxococcota bacterium]|nr:phosphate acyltransferase PlsX [Myxococcota bacterium]MEC8425130.1 phosphate acyltransferase PlsX [Myxococcota bacterium]
MTTPSLPGAIALDAMGTDLGPLPLVAGAAQAVRGGIPVVLVGDERVLGPLVPAGVDLPIRHASEVVGMAEAPAVAVRRKPDSSVNRAVEMVATGQACAVVSCGNTGGAMAAALFQLGRIDGVERPALTTIAPRADGGQLVLLDLGANADCRPQHLVQFALMGAVFARAALGLEHPRIGLLSNGEEMGKGNELVRMTGPLLAETDLDFVGNVEPTGAFGGQCDVLVTDGFTGNVMLKTVEATAQVVTNLLRAEARGAVSRAVGARLLAPLLRRFRERTDARAVGGALLLGVKGLVVVGHGRSDARAVASALRHAAGLVESGLGGRTDGAIQRAIAGALPVEPPAR